MAVRVGYRQPQTGGQGFSRTKKVIGGRVSLALTDVNQTANGVAIFRAPAGFTVTSLYAVAGSILGAAMTINIGDAASANRFLAASTFGQSTTPVTAVAATGSYYTFPADTDVILQPAAAGTTAGDVTVYLEGFMA